MGNDYSYDDLQGEMQVEEFLLFLLGLALKETKHFFDENKLREGNGFKLSPASSHQWTPDVPLLGRIATYNQVLSLGNFARFVWDELVRTRPEPMTHLTQSL
ncbi:hypothetical protein QYF36_023532 [Acer negundo]|nr:hypothetical protein QYF36_023532 [Acer negundo]